MSSYLKKKKKNKDVIKEYVRTMVTTIILIVVVCTSVLIWSRFHVKEYVSEEEEINRIKKENLLEKVNQLGIYLFNKLKEISKNSKIISGVRGVGMLYGFDIPQEVSKQFLKELQKEGVLLQAIRQGRTCRLSPSYIIQKEDIDFLIEKINLVANKLEKDNKITTVAGIII